MTKPDMLVFSGAGFSAESGIPTFRGATGLWNNHRIADVCDYRTWKQNYDLVHNFYDGLRHDIKNCLPHQGFEILKILEKQYNITHFTTNVDNLYEKSGIQCQHVHGELTKIVCMQCNKISDIGYLSLEEAKEQNLLKHESDCHSNIVTQYKPAITFYHEGYDEYPAFNNLKKYIKNINHDTVVLIIGSSLEVIPLDYWLRHTRCYKYNINPKTLAGFKKDFKHWVNIKENACSGLHIFMEILKEYQ